MMFFSSSFEQLDPALLAFVKCHVTSPTRWEILRLLASRTGEWVSVEQLIRAGQGRPAVVAQTLRDLVADGLVEVRPPQTDAASAYRLPADEPTSVVLQRLIDTATHSLELRAIIAAHLQRVRQHAAPTSTTVVA